MVHEADRDRRQREGKWILRAELLDLMRVLANGIVGEEALADVCAREASRREARGERDASGVLRDAARMHRVKALELEGQLTVLRAEYIVRFHDGPDAFP